MAWYNASWKYRKKITIDNTKVSGSSNHADFPVLISLLSDGNLQSDAQSDGDDILFTSSDGTTKLSHEIETFTKSSGLLVAWVKVPTLLATSDTDLYMYFGNPDASNQQDAANVWDSNFKGVHHMKEAPNTTFQDSTSNDNDATDQNGDAGDTVTDMIGKGVTLDGSAEYITTATSYNNPNTYTIQSVFRTTNGYASGGKLMGFGNLQTGQSTNYDRHVWMENGGRMDYGIYDGSLRIIRSTGSYNDGQKHIFHAKLSSGGMKFYIDGVLIGTIAITAAQNYIGWWRYGRDNLTSWTNSPSSFYFGGDLDEGRISHSDRSEDWIITDTNNQLHPENFYSVGSVEEMPDTGTYSVVINGVDRTRDIINRTLVIDDVINDQANTCDFKLMDLTSNGIPETDEEIVITLANGTILFGGYIIGVKTSKFGTGDIVAQIHCVDYTRLLDRNLVHQSYESMTDEEIIEDIVAQYCVGLGITTDNVTAGATVDQVSYNYIQISQVLRKLSELTGRSWYIDYEKDIHYFELTDNPAPFDIDSTTSHYSKLQISKDSSQIKNRIYVRGGTKLSDATVYEEKGDGEKKAFVLPDKPHNVSIAVNGTPKTVGVKNVNLSGYDFYVNFQEKYVEQDAAATVLGTGDTLTVNYQYDIPILVAQEDTASIAAIGSKEFAIFDKSISTTQAAKDRATAELTDYANDLVEGSFETMVKGFRTGQTINISLTDHDVSEDYLVQRVRAESIGGGKFIYTVSIASSKTMGIIKFLIELLEANKNLIELDDDEVIDELFQLSDSLNGDSLLDSLVDDSAGPYRTWAVGGAPTPSTRLRWDLGQWK